MQKIIAQQPQELTSAQNYFQQKGFYISESFQSTENLWDWLLRNPAEFHKLIQLCSELRLICPFDYFRNKSTSPSEAGQQGWSLQFGENLRVNLMSESFRRIILEVQGSSMSDFAELLIPGEQAHKLDNDMDIRQHIELQISRRYPNRCQKVLSAHKFENGTYSLYNREIHFDGLNAEFQVGLIEHVPNARRFDMVEQSLLRGWATQIGMPWDRYIMHLVDQIAKCTLAVHASGYFGSNGTPSGHDMHLGNFSVTPQGTVRMVSDFTSYRLSNEISNSLFLRSYDIRNIIDNLYMLFFLRVPMKVRRDGLEEMLSRFLAIYNADPAAPPCGINEYLEEVQQITREMYA